MAGRFLGTGMSFTSPDEQSAAGTGVNGSGQVLEASDDEKVRQAIWIVLGTARGERLMRPEFGCGLHDLVYETFSAGALSHVVQEVEDALGRWEPRIDLLRVNAWPDDQAPNLIQIEVSYRVRSTNSRFNLVYPFYLG